MVVIIILINIDLAMHINDLVQVEQLWYRCQALHVNCTMCRQLLKKVFWPLNVVRKWISERATCALWDRRSCTGVILYYQN